MANNFTENVTHLQVVSKVFFLLIKPITILTFQLPPSSLLGATLWSLCEVHVKTLWDFYGCETSCETPCEIKSPSCTRLILPFEKLCEIVTYFSNWKSRVKQYVKYPLIVRNILRNQNHCFKIWKLPCEKNCEILSFYYGPKKAYETPWEIRMGFLQLNEFWGWCSPVKKCMKSYSNLLIHINFVCSRFA